MSIGSDQAPPRFDVGPNARAFYREFGYVVVADLFEKDDLAATRDAIFDLFGRRLGQTGERALADGQSLDLDVWRQCARRMYDLLPVYGLAVAPRVPLLLSALGLESPLISTRPEVRTDMPGDAQYTQPWHQDWRYGQGSVNAITIWIPLHDVSVENGTVEVMPGSHGKGYLDVEQLDNPRRFAIAEEQLGEFESVPAEMVFGEALVFSQFLVHRSGYNQSGRPRVTVQLRFSDAAEPCFAKEGFPTPAGSELAWENPPSAATVAEVFSNL